MVGETGDYVKLVAIVKKKVSSANRYWHNTAVGATRFATLLTDLHVCRKPWKCRHPSSCSALGVVETTPARTSMTMYKFAAATCVSDL